jgi:hypothetical protein
MLSKRNLKGKEPSLCLTMDMLLRLLALRFDFAYFSNFWAYFLWLINSFSSLFILDFKEHSHLFR